MAPHGRACEAAGGWPPHPYCDWHQEPSGFEHGNWILQLHTKLDHMALLS